MIVKNTTTRRHFEILNSSIADERTDESLPWIVGSLIDALIKGPADQTAMITQGARAEESNSPAINAANDANVHQSTRVPYLSAI